MARPVRENVFGGGGGNLDILNPVILSLEDLFYGGSKDDTEIYQQTPQPTNNGHVPTGATSEPHVSNGEIITSGGHTIGNDSSYGARDLQSDVDIWNHLNRWVWGKSGAQSSPTGDWKAEPTALKTIMHRQHDEQEGRITAGKKHRDSIEAKVEDIYDTKANKGHSHADSGDMEWYVKIAIIAVIGLIVYFVIRRKFL